MPVCCGSGQCTGTYSMISLCFFYTTHLCSRISGQDELDSGENKCAMALNSTQHKWSTSAALCLKPVCYEDLNFSVNIPTHLCYFLIKRTFTDWIFIFAGGLGNWSKFRWFQNLVSDLQTRWWQDNVVLCCRKGLPQETGNEFKIALDRHSTRILCK